MSDLQSSKRRVSSAANPRVFSRDPEKDLVWSGKAETFEEKESHLQFVENIWGRQDDGPRIRRGRRDEGKS